MLARTLLPLILGAGLLGACDSGTSRPSAAPTSSSTAPAAAASAAPSAQATPPVAGLTRVEDVTQVCMVTNQFMGTAQIPVEVEGKTYFGCCEMCKARLAKEPETRTAKDPVTGEAVDKASAVIAREASGKVLYFASADTLARFRATP